MWYDMFFVDISFRARKRFLAHASVSFEWFYRRLSFVHYVFANMREAWRMQNEIEYFASENLLEIFDLECSFFTSSLYISHKLIKRNDKKMTRMRRYGSRLSRSWNEHSRTHSHEQWSWSVQEWSKKRVCAKKIRELKRWKRNELIDASYFIDLIVIIIAINGKVNQSPHFLLVEYFYTPHKIYPMGTLFHILECSVV